jgi:hypothetical protein
MQACRHLSRLASAGAVRRSIRVNSKRLVQESCHFVDERGPCDQGESRCRHPWMNAKHLGSCAASYKRRLWPCGANPSRSAAMTRTAQVRYGMFLREAWKHQPLRVPDPEARLPERHGYRHELSYRHDRRRRPCIEQAHRRPAASTGAFTQLLKRTEAMPPRGSQMTSAGATQPPPGPHRWRRGG